MKMGSGGEDGLNSRRRQSIGSRCFRIGGLCWDEQVSLLCLIFLKSSAKWRSLLCGVPSFSIIFLQLQGELGELFLRALDKMNWLRRLLLCRESRPCGLLWLGQYGPDEGAFVIRPTLPSHEAWILLTKRSSIPTNRQAKSPMIPPKPMVKMRWKITRERKALKVWYTKKNLGVFGIEPEEKSEMPRLDCIMG